MERSWNVSRKLISVFILVGCLLTNPAQAAFTSLPGINAVYDDQLDITWYTHITYIDGWSTAAANASAFTLDVNGTLYDNWRLPTVNVDGAGGFFDFTGPLCSSNPSGCVDNELMYNFYFNDLSVFTNALTGPGIYYNWIYFSSDAYNNPAAGGPVVQVVTPYVGLDHVQGETTQAAQALVFLVHDGNILTTVPEPSTYVLFITGLLGLLLLRRRT
jgi:hypothetical protein